MAQSERGGVIVVSTTSSSPEGSIAVVGSTCTSLAAGMSTEARAALVVSPHDLFEVPVLG